MSRRHAWLPLAATLLVVAACEDLSAQGRGRAGGDPPATGRPAAPRDGIPYGANATLEEWYDRFTEPNGDDWLVVTSIVTDPQYLTGPYASTNHFRKIPDKQGWDPTPCRGNEAR